MPRSGRARRTAAALAVSAVLAATGSVSASYSATTETAANSTSTGTVAVQDNDGGTIPLITPSLDGSLAPGRGAVRCVQVTYTGSLPAQVRLYVTATTLGDPAAFQVTIERGSGLTKEFPRCNGFAAGGTVLPPTVGTGVPLSWDSGSPVKTPGTTWAAGETVSLRVTVTATDDPAPNARRSPRSTGAAMLVLEARSV